eukprot:TRINITY_DN9572_c0_g1_i2.p1 TRINITY_DN9572_c0_g1~~TRINITY_DN9572_c0_g1_i2.p1  ORF type:complete len:248 (+),score=33.33 TRINITY_DN9572_c0_g1_i2:90-833(+)
MIHCRMSDFSSPSLSKSAEDRADRLLSRVLSMSVDDWRIDPQKIVIGREIGAGFFGRVYEANYLGTHVCVKEVQVPSKLDAEAEFGREVMLLKSLRHPFVVLFMGVSKGPTAGSMLIVQEYVRGGSLFNLLQDKTRSIPWGARIKMAMEVSQALSYLHDHSVLHRDLKAENVLIDDNSAAAFSDMDHAHDPQKVHAGPVGDVLQPSGGNAHSHPLVDVESYRCKVAGACLASCPVALSVSPRALCVL